MVNSDTKEKFIELRAAGHSFDSIAKQLDISKPTALKLGNEFEQHIKRLQFINLEAMAEQYKLAKQFRIEGLAKLLEQVDTALQSVDFSKMAPEKLVALKCQLIDRLKQELVIPCNIDTVMCAPTDTDKATGHYILKID